MPLPEPQRAYRARGAWVFAKTLRVPRTLVESVVLESIQRDLLTEEGLAVFTAELTRQLDHQCRTRTPDLKGQGAAPAVEQEIVNIIAAIRQGIITASTKEALEQAEAERATCAGWCRDRIRKWIRLPASCRIWLGILNPWWRLLRR